MKIRQIIHIMKPEFIIFLQEIIHFLIRFLKIKTGCSLVDFDVIQNDVIIVDGFTINNNNNNGPKLKRVVKQTLSNDWISYIGHHG